MADTPTPMGRPLEGLSLGLSISEAVDEDGVGFDTRDVNRAVRDVSRAILAQGGRVVFGHDWRSGGVMSEVLNLAMVYRRSDANGPATLRNFYVPTVGQGGLSDADRERYRGVLEVTAVPPRDVDDGAGLNPPSSASREADAAAFTHLRKRLLEETQARLCLGGRTSGYKGWCSGIVEEAGLALDHGQPLYLSALYGGAAAEVIAALSGVDPRTLPAFGANPEGAEGGWPTHGLSFDPTRFRQVGIDGLTAHNRLTPEENAQLITAPDLNTIISLTLRGLGRLGRGTRVPAA